MEIGSTIQPRYRNPRKPALQHFYPEARFGGFTDIDGTLTFYLRVNAMIKPTDVVIDFGCGQGTYVNDPVPIRCHLRTLRNKVGRVIGIDVDAHAAQNPFLDEFRQLRPGTGWPIDTRSTDLVLCDNVIEHLPNPELFFSEAARVLRPGGHVCIRTPNVMSYFGIASKLVPNKHHAAVLRVAQQDRDECFPTVYRANTIRALRRMMGRHGFEHAVYGYEAEPAYLSFSHFAYALGVLHQRLAPSRLRVTIFAFGRLAQETLDQPTLAQWSTPTNYPD